MINRVSAPEFMEMAEDLTIIDVRTPAEYERGHIPGALNLPLFSNEERAIIGTLYKQEGPEVAKLRGLELVGPRLTSLCEKAAIWAGGRSVGLYCWRGGQRSGSVGWLLDMYGLEVKTLIGGYKAFRRHLDDFLTQPFKIVVLGGHTGCGKTILLKEMQRQGEQVLDLESLANHKGSAFGSLGEEDQPTSEHFTNLLYRDLRQLDSTERIWVENESKAIGKVFIPDSFWSTMKASPLLHLDVNRQERVELLVQTYADSSSKDELIECFRKITKRLGGQHVKAAVEALGCDDFAKAAEIALVYYDKTYNYNLEKNQAPMITRMPVAWSLGVRDIGRGVIAHANREMEVQV